MKATANLENDHVHILRLIEVMERIIHKPEIKLEHMETIVGLLQNYADKLHHFKEENLLFPKMVEKGFSFQSGPIAIMMQDHVQGRNFVKGMADNIALYKADDHQSLPDIYKNMLGYIELLRAHISKENNILFRMADKALSEDEQQNLVAEFESLERNSICGETVSHCIHQIENLAKAYHIR